MAIKTPNKDLRCLDVIEENTTTICSALKSEATLRWPFISVGRDVLCVCGWKYFVLSQKSAVKNQGSNKFQEVLFGFRLFCQFVSPVLGDTSIWLLVTKRNAWTMRSAMHHRPVTFKLRFCRADPTPPRNTISLKKWTFIMHMLANTGTCMRDVRFILVATMHLHIISFSSKLPVEYFCQDCLESDEFLRKANLSGKSNCEGFTRSAPFLLEGSHTSTLFFQVFDSKAPNKNKNGSLQFHFSFWWSPFVETAPFEMDSFFQISSKQFSKLPNLTPKGELTSVSPGVRSFPSQCKIPGFHFFYLVVSQRTLQKTMWRVVVVTQKDPQSVFAPVQFGWREPLVKRHSCSAWDFLMVYCS